MRQRYAITYVSDRSGLRTLRFANQGHNHYDDPKHAAAWLRAALKNSPTGLGSDREKISLAVSPVECYDHGDATGIYVDAVLMTLPDCLWLDLASIPDSLAGRGFWDEIKRYWPTPTRPQLATARRVCAQLAALARPYAMIQVADCNGIPEAARPALAESARKIEDQARALIAELPPLTSGKRAGVKFTGDPRGFTLRVVIPDAPHDGNTWGRDGEFGIDPGYV